MEKMEYEVQEISNLGIGTRVSIDFIDELEADEFVFVGNASAGMVGVLSESRVTENYSPRKFRINAGAAMQYVYCGDEKTKYLSELEPGEKITVFSLNGERKVAIGRIKKEKRELLRIVLKSDENYISATLQNADSVYLVADKPKAVIELEEADKVFVFSTGLKATHKGELIDEYIEEK